MKSRKAVILGYLVLFLVVVLYSWADECDRRDAPLRGSFTNSIYGGK